MPDSTISVAAHVTGLRRAVERLDRASAALDPVDTFVPLFEALNWVASIDQRIGSIWRPDGEHLKTNWRAKVAHGPQIAAVAWVRNAVHHQWIDALALDPSGHGLAPSPDLFPGPDLHPRADHAWMRLLRDGGHVWVEVDEWVNKSSGRGSITLVGKPAGGEERLERARSVYLPRLPYETVIPRLFPWADLAVDEDFYVDKESELWELEEGMYDSEEGRVIMVGIGFDDWREMRGLTGLRPYEVKADEVARWRLLLELNELGRSLLVVDGFLSDG